MQADSYLEKVKTRKIISSRQLHRLFQSYFSELDHTFKNVCCMRIKNRSDNREFRLCQVRLSVNAGSALV